MFLFALGLVAALYLISSAAIHRGVRNQIMIVYIWQSKHYSSGDCKHKIVKSLLIIISDVLSRSLMTINF